MSRGDTTNREQAQRNWDKAQREQLERAFSAQLATPEGRLFVRWLLLISGWDAEPMTGNSHTYYNLGAQKVGREVRDTLIGVDRNGWRRLEDEALRDADVAISLRAIPD